MVKHEVISIPTETREVKKDAIETTEQTKSAELEAKPEYPRDYPEGKTIWHQCHTNECQTHAAEKIEAWMKFKLHHEEKFRKQKKKSLLTAGAGQD